MYYIGLDIGGTKCAVCIGEVKDGVLTLIDKEKFATGKGRDPYEVLAELHTHSVSVLEKHGMSFSDIAGIGISCGGPLDASRGVILSPPNLPGWDEVAIVDYLKKKYHVPVVLQNDANACAVAEWRYGAGKGCKNMVFLTFGTGMGAGLILNGQLYAGTNDMAGEIGHVRMSGHGPVGYGKAGSFEGFCSGAGIAQIAQTQARERLQMGKTVSYCSDIRKLNDISAKSVAQAASQGAEDALEVYSLCGEMLGRGLAILIDLLNPERIVLGSIYQRSGHLLKEAMEKYLSKETLPLAYRVCKILPAKLQENIGDYAALAVASMGICKNGE